MNAPLPTSFRFDPRSFVQVITQAQGVDALTPFMSTTQWETLAGYMQPFALLQGQVLIEQGGLDRSLYFVETGSLSVHYEDSRGRVRLSMVGPGGVVGEGAFFSYLPRRATVQANIDCKLWCLTPIRFTELSNRQPAIGLELCLAAGGVMARRFANKTKRAAVT